MRPTFQCADILNPLTRFDEVAGLRSLRRGWLLPSQISVPAATRPASTVSCMAAFDLRRGAGVTAFPALHNGSKGDAASPDFIGRSPIPKNYPL